LLPSTAGLLAFSSGLFFIFSTLSGLIVRRRAFISIRSCR